MKQKKYGMVILLVAFIFVLPTIISHKMIVGADALFHYNRFYDAAMQIKNGHFSYFISIYGFQQSGRIVNALYGPVFAYFQGLLVLIAGSWYKYQIISNFLILTLSGFAMYRLLTYAKVKKNLATVWSILFMTTYGVQYWLLNQGFTAWGSAILPLALLPMVDLIYTKKFQIVKIAVAMAVMTQIHMLSALMLGLIYGLFYLAFLWQTHPKKIFLPVFKAALLYIALTLNIWISFVSIYLQNQLQMPFINHNMSLKAINLAGRYWLIYPGLLLPLVLICLAIGLFSRKKITALAKLSLAFSGIFLILATSLIPWTKLVAAQVPLVSLIQFPFRFFVPFTVLFFLFAAIMLNDLTIKKLCLYCIFCASLAYFKESEF